jgi:hypothetical protein
MNRVSTERILQITPAPGWVCPWCSVACQHRTKRVSKCATRTPQAWVGGDKSRANGNISVTKEQ